MISALFVLLICASLAMVRRYKVPSIATRTVTGTSLVVSRQNAVALHATQQNSPANRDTTSSEPRAETVVEVVVRDDPAELWKRVQSGSANAEVELAKLYLDGRGVVQNCEQAHLLLLAASKKRSNAASNLLSGDYVRRCQ
jgi:TPR repeat protein